MSDAERQRRLHVANRLAELRAKHGRDLEGEAMPSWLDTLEGLHATQAQERALRAASEPEAAAPPQEPPAPRPTPRPPQGPPAQRAVWDR